MKNLISAALFGALTFGTASIVVADHDRDRYEQRDDDRVLDSKRLRSDRTHVEFDVPPGLHRDGLMLVANGYVGISKVQFVYEGGSVVTLKGRKLARMPKDDGALTIQVGRPGGLRHVRVWYQLAPRQQSAKLKLVSFGDGYTTTD